jgi:hypothetical protein
MFRVLRGCGDGENLRLAGKADIENLRLAVNVDSLRAQSRPMSSLRAAVKADVWTTCAWR